MSDKPMRIERTLQELAAQINAAHQACQGAMTEGLRHAVQAGEALREAKARVPHGAWLPWLREHCIVSERTAQAYMRVARELSANAQRVAGLPLREALAELAAPSAPPGESPEPDIWAEAEKLLESPFSAFDFEEGNLHWLTTKLVHQAEVPAVAGICLSLREHDSRALCLCPNGELVDAIARLAPLMRGEVPVRFDSGEWSLNEAMHRAVALKLVAQRLLGLFFEECESRSRRSTERHAAKCDQVIARILARVDERLSELEATPLEPVAG